MQRWKVTKYIYSSPVVKYSICSVLIVELRSASISAIDFSKSPLFEIYTVEFSGKIIPRVKLVMKWLNQRKKKERKEGTRERVFDWLT